MVAEAGSSVASLGPALEVAPAARLDRRLAGVGPVPAGGLAVGAAALAAAGAEHAVATSLGKGLSAAAHLSRVASEQQAALEAEASLRALRDRMRDLGLQRPQLPRDLTHLDDGPPSGLGQPGEPPLPSPDAIARIMRTTMAKEMRAERANRQAARSRRDKGR